jgi:hypothetical protein
LEGLSRLKKLAFVKSISKVPKSVARDIQEINALRNGLAHAFFPENLRTSKPDNAEIGVSTVWQLCFPHLLIQCDDSNKRASARKQKEIQMLSALYLCSAIIPIRKDRVLH